MAANYPDLDNPVLNIFKFENEKIVYNVQNFEKLINDSGLGDYKVCVIGILGKLRGGKSFFLNLVRSYLLSLANSEEDDESFIKNLETLKGGFVWQNGEEPCTAGIDILNEILVFETSKKEKIAIVLVDCQGSHDNATSTQADAKLFALSTLFTSIQIYNLHKNISESDLQILEVFSKFSEMAKKKKSDKIPFQSLWFLVRDWHLTNNYGTDAGQKHLDKWFSSNDILEKRKRRQLLRNLYKHLQCATLPHPGLEFTDSEKHSDLTECFKDAIKSVLGDLFDQINIEQNLKTVDGNVLKLSHLPHYLAPLVEFFNESSQLEIASMYEGTVKATYNVALKKAIEKYTTLTSDLINEEYRISNDKLKKKHESAEKEAEELFKSSHTMFQENIDNDYTKMLKDEISNRLKDLKIMNKRKASKEEIEKAYNTTVSVIIKLYAELMVAVRKSLFKMELVEIEAEHEKAQSQALDKYNSEGNFQHETIKDSCRNLLKEQIRDELNAIKTVNEQKKTKDEVNQYYDKQVTEAIESYNKEMKTTVESFYQYPDIEVKYKNSMALKIIQNHFNANILDEKYKEINESTWTKIENKIIPIFGQIESDNSKKPIEKTIDEVCEKSYQVYLVNMEEITKSPYQFNEKQLNEAHDDARNRAVTILKNFPCLQESDTATRTKTEKRVIDRVNNEFVIIKDDNGKKLPEDDIRKQFQSVVEDCLNIYKKNMDALSSSENRVASTRLMKQNISATNLALQNYLQKKPKFSDIDLSKAYELQLQNEIECEFNVIIQENSDKSGTLKESFGKIITGISDSVGSLATSTKDLAFSSWSAAKNAFK